MSLSLHENKIKRLWLTILLVVVPSCHDGGWFCNQLEARGRFIVLNDLLYPFKYENSTPSPRSPGYENGLPQRGVLSPLLMNHCYFEAIKKTFCVFWRQLTQRTLATGKRVRGKKNKQGITATI
jgi:hypothetical protein